MPQSLLESIISMALDHQEQMARMPKRGETVNCRSRKSNVREMTFLKEEPQSPGNVIVRDRTSRTRQK
jgi:hypothetical protein